MATVERPDGFRDYHHRALVLIAGSPSGMHVTTVTTSESVEGPVVAWLYRRRLVQITGPMNDRLAHVTETGRALLYALHEEARA